MKTAAAPGRRGLTAALLVALAVCSGSALSAGGTPSAPAGLPLDLQLRDEAGSSLRLGDLLDVPTILSSVNSASDVEGYALQTLLASALGAVRLPAGSAYRVVTVDRNPRADAAELRTLKNSALASVGAPFPASAWLSLGLAPGATAGDADSNTVAVLAPGGRVVRILHGPVILPLDLGLALLSASPNPLKRASASVLRFCLVFDRVNQHYALNILRLSGIVILVLAGVIALYLILSGGRRRKRAGAGV
ncbi:MAG TPA: hypothetical protein VMC79_09695 [Rectinemataceae bacterium]|nr:hypothetical protein [Rectinemataceae bacterium]